MQNLYLQIKGVLYIIMSTYNNTKGSIIFYGAGQNAIRNLKKWEMEGLVPVCFVDSDIEKHNTCFCDTQYKILPLLEAISKYPDFCLYITLVPSNVNTIVSMLRGLGVPKERIFYCENVEYRRGCDYINRFLQITISPDKLYFRSCCYQSKPYLYTGNERGGIKDSYLSFVEYRYDLIRKLKDNIPCECDGCVALRWDYWQKEININTLTMDGGFKGERCNVKCSYCHAESSQEASLLDSSWSYTDVLNEIAAYLPQNLTLSPSASEFTISPHKSEIFEIMNEKQWSGDFLSSGLLFETSIANMMRASRASMHISVDAGTRETFAKVKGFDYWDKLNQNIKRYAETGGELSLKYIFLEDINDNLADVDGFIELAQKYVKKIYISIDTNKTRSGTPLTNNMRNMMARFVSLASEKGLKCFVVWDRFNGNSELVNVMKEILPKARG